MPQPRSVGAAGTALAAGGAVAYGVTVVVGRSLADAGLGPATALGVRFGVAAVCLLALLGLRRAPLRPLPGELRRILLLGAVGYTAESTLFYLSLQRGTAAACALLFYAYPAIVSVIEVARGRERPTRATLAALLLSVSGTAVVVAAGSDVSISGAGIAFALGSAATYAVYLLVGRELGRRSDPMTAACWVAIGASASSLARGALTSSLSDPRDHLGQLALYGVATAVAFWLIFAALARIGTARTAVVSTLEAFSAIVLAAVFLGEKITAAQAAGGAAILVAAGIIAATASSNRPPEDPPLTMGAEVVATSA
ncbi:MAG: DMT family transporter [Acidimicrobiales bacterium]|nr:DMT family transporter [Actinomycetota bacterium]